MGNKAAYLAEMGIEVWKLKNPPTPKGLEASLSWSELEDQVIACHRCILGNTRTKVVFGTGAQNAEIMFVGEAPGAQEDLIGEPFVGRSGMLLNEMIKAIGLARQDVYITSVLKCRPPKNRDPQTSEAMQCAGYLHQQIALVNPKLLVALGRVAAQYLLNTTEAMSSLRGKIHHYGSKGWPLLVTYHPAYLLRSPSEKGKAYEDFLLLKKTVPLLKRLQSS